jgi:hypothetical protein
MSEAVFVEVTAPSMPVNETVAFHAPFLPRPPPSVTARADALCCVAATLRLSLRAITVVFVFSRASVLSVRTSSFVHGRLRVIFFAISVPHAPMLPTNQSAIVDQKIGCGAAPTCPTNQHQCAVPAPRWPGQYQKTVRRATPRHTPRPTLQISRPPDQVIA